MKRFFLLVVLILAGVLVSININKPFVGQHDWNGVVYGQQAKNFVRFGYLPLKFGATLSTGDTLPGDRKFSTHYTPILPILISFSYRLFGVSEWSTRLVPAAASLASVFLVILLGRELISFRAGIIAGILMAVTPMFIYYGKNPVHEVVLLPFALLSFYSYQCFLKTNKDKWWKTLLLASTAAMLTGWPGYYAAGLIAAHGFLTEKKFRARFLALPMLMVGLFSLFLLHGYILDPKIKDELQRIGLSRMSGGGFRVSEFVAKELRYSINLFTATLLGLAGIWVIGFLIKLTRILSQVVSSHCEERQRRGNLKTILLGLIGIFGISHVLLFRDAGWYHEYLLFPVLPFVVLAAAGVIHRFRPLIILIILVLVAVERVGYAKALINSEYVRDTFEEAIKFDRHGERQELEIPAGKDIYFIFYADQKGLVYSRE